MKYIQLMKITSYNWKFKASHYGRSFMDSIRNDFTAKVQTPNSLIARNAYSNGKAKINSTR